mmetsp:Transcript_3974/g.9364  ORF Transcript_3974/g.9364 Transcript_3974/m.9364 type:complete len:319 (+) Transcript_3974:1608-2564(+)
MLLTDVLPPGATLTRAFASFCPMCASILAMCSESEHIATQRYETLRLIGLLSKDIFPLSTMNSSSELRSMSRRRKLLRSSRPPGTCGGPRAKASRQIKAQARQTAFAAMPASGSGFDGTLNAKLSNSVGAMCIMCAAKRSWSCLRRTGGRLMSLSKDVTISTIYRAKGLKNFGYCAKVAKKVGMKTRTTPVPPLLFVQTFSKPSMFSCSGERPLETLPFPSFTPGPATCMSSLPKTSRHSRKPTYAQSEGACLWTRSSPKSAIEARRKASTLPGSSLGISPGRRVARAAAQMWAEASTAPFPVVGARPLMSPRPIIVP